MFSDAIDELQNGLDELECIITYYVEAKAWHTEVLKSISDIFSVPHPIFPIKHKYTFETLDNQNLDEHLSYIYILGSANEILKQATTHCNKRDSFLDIYWHARWEYEAAYGMLKKRSCQEESHE